MNEVRENGGTSVTWNVEGPTNTEVYVDYAPLQEAKGPDRKKINCDQVSSIRNALNRLVEMVAHRVPMVSRLHEAAQLAALLEIMEVLGYEFEDKMAAGNALSSFWEFNEIRDLH